MKIRIAAIILVMIAAVLILSACSNGVSSASEAPSSSTAPISSIVSVVEVSEADSSVQEESNEDKDTETKEPQFVRIDADGGLRMREGAGVDFDVIVVIPKNTYVEIDNGVEEIPEWIYVQYEDDIGWINAEYVVYEERQPSSSYTPNWAQLYFDHLSDFEAIFSEDGKWYWGSQVIQTGYKNYTVQIEFRQFQDYDYPIMIRYDCLIDGPPVVITAIDIVENGQVFSTDNGGERWKQFFEVPEQNTPIGELKGEVIKDFDFKENLSANWQDVLSWLKFQGAVGQELQEPVPVKSAAWQDEYAAFLKNPENYYMMDGIAPNGFYLYDIDKSGTPELVLSIGTMEIVYTYTNSSVVRIYDIEMGGISIPNNKALSGIFALQGKTQYYYVTLENGEIKETLIVEGGGANGKDIIHNQQLYDEKTTSPILNTINKDNFQRYIYS